MSRKGLPAQDVPSDRPPWDREGQAWRWGGFREAKEAPPESRPAVQGTGPKGRRHIQQAGFLVTFFPPEKSHSPGRAKSGRSQRTKG